MTAFKSFTDKIFNLDDLATIYDDDSPIVTLRPLLVKELVAEFGHSAEQILLVYEFEGICKALHKRFESQMRAYSRNFNYLGDVSWKCTTLHQWLYKHRETTSASPPFLFDSTFRLKLRGHYFVWVHKGLVRDGSIQSAKSCFCPILACLQHCIINTKAIDWLAAVNSDTNDSPLAFAWNLAREDPQVGEMTADVVALVQMGYCTYSGATLAAESDAYARAYTDGCTSGGARSPTLGNSSALRNRIAKRARTHVARVYMWLDDSIDEEEEEKQEDELHVKVEKEETNNIKQMRKAAYALTRCGDRYATSIESQASPQSRAKVVDEIRSTFKELMSLAKPDLAFWGKKWHPGSLKIFFDNIDDLCEAE